MPGGIGRCLWAEAKDGQILLRERFASTCRFSPTDFMSAKLFGKSLTELRRGGVPESVACALQRPLLPTKQRDEVVVRNLFAGG